MYKKIILEFFQLIENSTDTYENRSLIFNQLLTVVKPHEFRYFFCEIINDFHQRKLTFFFHHLPDIWKSFDIDDWRYILEHIDYTGMDSRDAHFKQIRLFGYLMGFLNIDAVKIYMSINSIPKLEKQTLLKFMRQKLQNFETEGFWVGLAGIQKYIDYYELLFTNYHISFIEKNGAEWDFKCSFDTPDDDRIALIGNHIDNFINLLL
jgi:hypothetical protein